RTLHVRPCIQYTRLYLVFLVDNSTICSFSSLLYFFFFFNDTSTTEIYTLSLHDALPILRKTRYMHKMRCLLINRRSLLLISKHRSEERFSRNAETDLVCRLLLEKKKKKKNKIIQNIN